MAGSFPSGLTVWARYKASTQVAVGNGNAVLPADISGNGRDTTQATASRKPLMRTAVSGLLGNTAAFEFLGDNTNPHCVAPPDMSALTSGFVAAYLIVDADLSVAGSTNIRRIWEMGSSTDGYYKYATTTGSPPGIYENFGTTARKTCGDTNPTSGVLSVWHSYMVASAAGAWSNYINNILFFTTGTNTVGFPAAPLIGGYPAGTTSTRLANKNYAEIVICSAVPSADDRAQLQQYFIDEYRGGLPHRYQVFTRQSQTRASFY